MNLPKVVFYALLSGYHDPGPNAVKPRFSFDSGWFRSGLGSKLEVGLGWVGFAPVS